MSRKIQIIDSTLRDGSHGIKHSFTEKQVKEYAKGAEEAGIEILIVGHGNGLGASSLQVGQSLLTDNQMLEATKSQLKKTKLGAFLIPGFGTIKDNLRPAIDRGIELLMVASHCTEVNITRQHIEYAKNKGLEVIGVLMMSHRLKAWDLLKQAKLMQKYGVDKVLLMDSAGAYDLERVQTAIHLLNESNLDIGFHAHNNLGLAVAGSCIAVQAGACFVDATSRGLGAGAGNCQLEVLVALLHKLKYDTGLDLKKLMHLSEQTTAWIMKEHNHYQVIDSACLASGLAGIFSGFKPHVLRAAKEYNIDPVDIFMELGKRKAVAGQEDLIVDVAMKLKNDCK